MRWQQANGFLLWQNPPEPAREAVWANEQGTVPLFKTQSALASFAGQLGFALVAQPPRQLNLDAVADWLTTDKKCPPVECLDVWNLFDDVGAGVNEPFAGTYKTPLRDQVFDLLYAASGPWHRPAKVTWPPAEWALLRDILTKGFVLWQKHACWQA
ncbi:MAG: hypothetical protein ACRYFZ_19825 [Janthinobacterium lividum]